jgi:hypothetical protein
MVYLGFLGCVAVSEDAGGRRGCEISFRYRYNVLWLLSPSRRPAWVCKNAPSSPDLADAA